MMLSINTSHFSVLSSSICRAEGRARDGTPTSYVAEAQWRQYVIDGLRKKNR